MSLEGFLEINRYCVGADIRHGLLAPTRNDRIMESRILQLIAALRASGVRVSLAESAEAFSAVDLMGIQDREHFRLSLRATLDQGCERPPHFR